MPQRQGRYVITLPGRPAVISYGSAVGKLEGEGPLGQEFDIRYPSDKVCSGTWEQNESRLAADAVNQALIKAGKTFDDVDLIFAGDLLNQCIASSFSIKNTDIPFVGLFGACSTMALGLSLAAVAVESGAAELAVAAASSHFCSAERQFRYPLEYGGQRTPTAQRTVTGAGAALVAPGCGKSPWVNAVMIGRIRDQGITDANNMGAAMAPAAACTIIDFLRDTGTTPDTFDMILTGDLGMVGSHLLTELLQKRENTDITAVHRDCGTMIFDLASQNVVAGGSGCGCSASVVCSHILRRLARNELHNVLFVGTGALMSTTSSQQGNNILGIAHAVWLSSPDQNGG